MILEFDWPILFQELFYDRKLKQSAEFREMGKVMEVAEVVETAKTKEVAKFRALLDLHALHLFYLATNELDTSQNDMTL